MISVPTRNWRLCNWLMDFLPMILCFRVWDSIKWPKIWIILCFKILSISNFVKKIKRIMNAFLCQLWPHFSPPIHWKILNWWHFYGKIRTITTTSRIYSIWDQAMANLWSSMLSISCKSLSTSTLHSHGRKLLTIVSKNQLKFIGILLLLNFMPELLKINSWLKMESLVKNISQVILKNINKLPVHLRNTTLWKILWSETILKLCSLLMEPEIK